MSNSSSGPGAANATPLALLVQRYERAALAVAWNVLHCWHDAGDVTQDAFMTAYEKLNQLSSARTFGMWVMRITHRLALRYLRRRRNTTVRLEADVPSLASDPALSAVSLDLLDLIGRLPTHERVVLSLRHLDGQSVAEIATIIGRPAGTSLPSSSRARYAPKGMA